MTKIEWTDETWNPVIGCSRVSKGCEHCYAERLAYRLAHMPQTKERYEGLTVKGSSGVRWTGKLRLVPEELDEPLRWRKPRRVFVNSMSDLFHEAVPWHFVSDVVRIMEKCPQHTFQIITKRARNMRDYFHAHFDGFKPLTNVHLYVSVEDQQSADERIPHLLQTPAAVRGLSMEPLLGPIVLKQQNPDGNWPPAAEQPDAAWLPHKDWPDDCEYWQAKAAGLHHVIVGGESGPGARPCNVEWIRSIRDQCAAANVPIFIKQLGADPRCEHTDADGDVPQAGGRLCLESRKGNDPTEWPDDLRVQEIPTGNGGE